MPRPVSLIRSIARNNNATIVGEALRPHPHSPSSVAYVALLRFPKGVVGVKAFNLFLSLKEEYGWKVSVSKAEESDREVLPEEIRQNISPERELHRLVLFPQGHQLRDIAKTRGVRNIIPKEEPVVQKQSAISKKLQALGAGVRERLAASKLFSRAKEVMKRRSA